MRGLWLSALFLQGCFYVTDDEYRARWDLDGDGVERPVDCDDSDDLLQVGTWFVDADGDGFGGPDTVTGCAPPAGAVAGGGDCDDADDSRHPGAAERCNGADDDCDDEVDEDLSFATWFPDLDEDGYGDPSGAVDTCDPPAGWLDRAGDCDDGDDAVHPEAVELCNGADDDCDDLVDEEAPTWTVDGDGDGHGAIGGPSVEACEPPDGYAAEGDCDDDDDAVHPGADEYCDPVDRDCNGKGADDYSVDATEWFDDCDEDGYGDPYAPKTACTDGVLPGACPLVAFGGDCDDADDGVNTAALEICNGIDDDCDMAIDDSCVDDTGAP